MGDLRFEPAYQRLKAADDRSAAIRSFSEEAVVQALAACVRKGDPLLANVLATELLNRVRRKRAALHHLGEGVVALDLKGQITYANPAAERILDWQEGALVSQSLEEIVNPEGPQGALRAQQCLREPLEHRASVHEEDITWSRRDGSRFPVACTAAPIRPEDEPEGVVVVFRDITREHEARQAQARLAGILAASTDAIIATDLEGTIRTWNRAATQLYGFEPSEIIGRSWNVLTPPDRRDEMDVLVQRAREGPVQGYETVRRRKDGSLVDVALTVSIQRDPNCGPAGFSIIARDNTQRKRMERELRQHRRLLEKLMDVAIERVPGINHLLVFDSTGRCLYVAPSTAKALGGDPCSLKGRRLEELPLPPALRDLMEEASRTRRRQLARLDARLGDNVEARGWGVTPIEEEGRVIAYAVGAGPPMFGGL